MVSRIGSLAARATVFLMSIHPNARREDRATYTSHVSTAINTLQDRWYDPQSGIWDEAWWNSANAFTTLADFATLDVGVANELNIGGILRNTFIRAQGEEVHVSKTINNEGLVSSLYTIKRLHVTEDDDEANNNNNNTEVPTQLINRQTFPGFINEFYDDEGWWALGLIRAFDVTSDQVYLDMAVSIFEDMKTGGDTNCGGGIYWNKERRYVNAIANELYLSVAASLANRIPANREYLDIAVAQWDWFKASGMINARGTINDGLNGQCENNRLNTWSYNQGVVLGGLIELARATENASLLGEAAAIAKAAIEELTDDEGILHETCEPDCGADGNQFKGIFARNLYYLHRAQPDEAFRTFILDNADSTWANNRDDNGGMGVNWSGPPLRVSGPTHSSALDVLVGAVGVI